MYNITIVYMIVKLGHSCQTCEITKKTCFFMIIHYSLIRGLIYSIVFLLIYIVYRCYWASSANVVRCGRYGPCLSKKVRCDGYNDCGDNSDERDCG